MTALPDVPNVLRVILRYTNNADVGKPINRLYFEFSGGAFTNAILNTFAANVEAAWATHCASLCPSESHLVEVDAVDLTTASSAVGIWTGSTDGSNAGTDNSAQLAYLVSMSIARRYRGGKPKTFLPYGTATDLASVGAFTSGFQTAVTAGWNAFIAEITALTPGGCVISGQVNVSYYGPPNHLITGSTGRVRTVSTLRTAALGTGAVLVDPITAYAYPVEVASQRRRTGRKR
jgi:hypothetical protein